MRAEILHASDEVIVAESCRQVQPLNSWLTELIVRGARKQVPIQLVTSPDTSLTASACAAIADAGRWVVHSPNSTWDGHPQLVTERWDIDAMPAYASRRMPVSTQLILTGGRSPATPSSFGTLQIDRTTAAASENAAIFTGSSTTGWADLGRLAIHVGAELIQSAAPGLDLVTAGERDGARP